MYWFFNNPIADMYGPTFLILYLFVVIVTLVVARRLAAGTARVEDAFPLPLPSGPDPYEIACLRGGEREVARLALFRLVREGYLIVEGRGSGSMISRAAVPPGMAALSEIERSVFDLFATPRNAGEAARRLPSAILSRCMPYEEGLRERRLLASADVKERVRTIKRRAMMVILGLGGYKLLVAFLKGKTNVVFLLIVMAVGIIILIRVCKSPRLTSLGRDYLDRMRTTFSAFKDRGGDYSTFDPQTLLLLVGVFGVGMLAGTAFDAIAATLGGLYPSSTMGTTFDDDTDSGGGGGGCGGGSDGGSDGGGCGGCGGGGD